MTRAVFIAHAVAEKCYLWEALLWTAVQRFPFAYETENGVDAREDHEYIEGLDPNDPSEPTLADDECIRLSLGPEPQRAADEAGDYHMSPREIRDMLRRTGGDEEYKKILEARLAEAEPFHTLQSAWEREFEAAIDLYKARLFLALREGRVTAMGRLLPKPTHNASMNHLEATRWEAWGNDDWVAIPSNFWISSKIEWSGCWAEGKSSAYVLILVDFEQLFAAFPPPVETTMAVVRTGNALVIQEDEALASAPKPARGRPSFDWDAFHIEVARRLQDNRLPTKQEAFIADMQEWCRSHWKRDVGRSTLLSKLKPYYDAFVRRSENPDQ